MDERNRQRELLRLTRYACQQGLLAEDYKHGLSLTSKGKKRLDRRAFRSMMIRQPKVWDGKWRLVIYDIPSTKNSQRIQLVEKMHTLGLLQLQQSVWIHPFACREQIEQISRFYHIERYITYIQTEHIDHDELLKERFQNIMLKGK